MRNKILTLSLAAALAVSACAPQSNTGMGSNNNPNNSYFNKQNIGTVAGAVGGGFAGNQIGKGKGNALATAGGAILGGLAGNSVGKSLDRSDAVSNGVYDNNRTSVNVNATLQNALENSRTGETSTWTNADGSRTSVTPTNTYSSNGQNCRDYTQSVSYGGTSYGSACRSNSGTWNIVR